MARTKKLSIRVSPEERKLFQSVAEQNQAEGNLSECVRLLMLKEANRLVAEKRT